tara:strand:+ start:2394 stop:4262 length:1869 start_codon:yes stop_codon:yes gene_type:complete
MAVVTNVGVPNVYSISYLEDTFNPLEAKIGEGTTGQKYASNYMGARSRWWDMSWRQAELESQGIAVHNKKIDDEILMLRDARANIIQGIPQRYDSMYKHHNLQTQKRAEWNASSGNMWTSTKSSGGGGYGDRGAGAKSQAIRAQVQKATTGLPSATARATNLELYRTMGDLGQDENSQDQSAYFAVQLRAQDLMNAEMNADRSKSKEDVAASSELQAIAEFEASTGGVDIAKRYKRHMATLSSGGSGGRTSTTSRKGKKALGSYGTTALERLEGKDGQGFDPWVHAEQTQVERIDDEVLDLESQRRSALDMIGRTREIKRENFGPSLLGSLRGLFTGKKGGEENWQAKQREEQGYAALQKYLEEAQASGTLQEALTELRGLVPEKVVEEAEDAVEAVAPVKEVDGLYPSPAVLAEKPWTPAPEEEFEFDAQDPDIAKAQDALKKAQERYDFAQMSIVGTHTPGDQQEMEDADNNLRAVQAWAESIGAAKNTGAEADLEKRANEAKAKETEAALLNGSGNDEVVSNRRGLLKAFSGASELLGKQKKMKRKVANAAAGSPEAYAASSMQAWRSQVPAQRSTLQDMISQTATEFNSMNDPKGAAEASKWLTALYSQETGLNLLKG